MKNLISFIFLFLIACKGTWHKSNRQTLEFGNFSIETPKGWTKIKASGTDPYVGRIAIDNIDTLDFDLGCLVARYEDKRNLDGQEEIKTSSTHDPFFKEKQALRTLAMIYVTC